MYRYEYVSVTTDGVVCSISIDLIFGKMKNKPEEKLYGY